MTPRGTLETRRLLGSGAGPSRDRMFIGSEGTLGVISRAWMRLQSRPKFRAGASVRFHSFFGAARALRAIAQAGLYPSNCRILDAQEAFNTVRPTAASRSWCSALNPATIRRMPGWHARSNAAPTMAGRRRPQKPTTHISKARQESGATHLFACPMRASF
jgi:FAD/FMN-containing dehydrogenase